MTVEEFAAKHRLKVARLEDGEVVVPLRGGKKGRYPSNNPHAGLWGEDLWYALVQTRYPSRTADAATRFDWALTFNITDEEVIVFGAPLSILALITKGPNAFRARTMRRLAPAHVARLVQSGARHRFAKSGASRVS